VVTAIGSFDRMNGHGITGDIFNGLNKHLSKVIPNLEFRISNCGRIPNLKSEIPNSKF
jgi:hypothetical protein